jgi:hypothetical protein
MGDDKAWVFPSGARIVFGYLETMNDLDRYQSADFQDIGFDEQNQFMGAQVTYMFSRLRRTRDFPDRFPMRVRGATNPGGIGHAHTIERYGIQDGQGFPEGSPPLVVRVGGKVRRVFVPAHASDNPGLDWEDYELSLSEMTGVKQKQLRDGIWIQDTAELVYSGEQRAKYVDSLPPGHRWEYGLVIDIGASRTTAFAILAMARDLPEVYLLLTEEPDDCNNPRDIAKHALLLDKVYHFLYIRGDHGALGKGYLDEMRKYFGIPISGVEKHDKRGYIDLLNGALETQMLRIVRGGTATWQKQAKAHLWKDERRLEEMPGSANHSLDAVLYNWREAKHYDHEESKAPDVDAPDAMEQAEMDAIDTERADLEDAGVQLPEGW